MRSFGYLCLTLSLSSRDTLGGMQGWELIVSMAQWIAHRTSNPGVVGSSPTVDAIFSPKSFLPLKINQSQIYIYTPAL